MSLVHPINLIYWSFLSKKSNIHNLFCLLIYYFYETLVLNFRRQLLRFKGLQQFDIIVVFWSNTAPRKPWKWQDFSSTIPSFFPPTLSLLCFIDHISGSIFIRDDWYFEFCLSFLFTTQISEIFCYMIFSDSFYLTWHPPLPFKFQQTERCHIFS